MDLAESVDFNEMQKILNKIFPAKNEESKHGPSVRINKDDLDKFKDALSLFNKKYNQAE